MTLLAHTTSDRHSLARSLRVMAATGTEVQLTMTSDQARALAADLDRLRPRLWRCICGGLLWGQPRCCQCPRLFDAPPEARYDWLHYATSRFRAATV